MNGMLPEVLDALGRYARWLELSTASPSLRTAIRLPDSHLTDERERVLALIDELQNDNLDDDTNTDSCTVEPRIAGSWGGRR